MAEKRTQDTEKIVAENVSFSGKQQIIGSILRKPLRNPQRIRELSGLY